MKKRSEETREWGDEDAGETAGEGGGCSSPPLPCFSYQKPTRQCKNYAPPRSSSIISPEWQGGFIFRNVDDGAVWYPHTTPFRAVLPTTMTGAA